MVVCAVLPSFKRVAAILEGATAIVISPDCLTFTNIKLAMNVFPMPPGASKKNNLPLLFSTLSIIVPNACYGFVTNFG